MLVLSWKTFLLSQHSLTAVSHFVYISFFPYFSQYPVCVLGHYMREIQPTWPGTIYPKIYISWNTRSFQTRSLKYVLSCFCTEECWLQARLGCPDPEVAEEKTRQNYEGQHKKEQIEIAEQTRQAPVDESQVVHEMSDFIDTHDTVEDGASTAFKVRLSFFTLLVQIDGRRSGTNRAVLVIQFWWFIIRFWLICWEK